MCSTALSDCRKMILRTILTYLEEKNMLIMWSGLVEKAKVLAAQMLLEKKEIMPIPFGRAVNSIFVSLRSDLIVPTDSFELEEKTFFIGWKMKTDWALVSLRPRYGKAVRACDPGNRGSLGFGGGGNLTNIDESSAAVLRMGRESWTRASGPAIQIILCTIKWIYQFVWHFSSNE